MVNLTKEKALVYLLKLKRKNQIGSSKYTAIGALRIFVKKNIISVEDIVEEFPELDTVQFQQDVDNSLTLQEKEQARRFAIQKEPP